MSNGGSAEHPPSTKIGAGEPLTEFFRKLRLIYDQLLGTPQALDDNAYCSHVFDMLPEEYIVLAINQMEKPANNIDSFCSALKENETRLNNRLKSATEVAMLHQTAAGSTPATTTGSTESALFANGNNNNGNNGGYRNNNYRGGNRNRGNYSGNQKNNSRNMWCRNCRTQTHNTDNCRSGPRNRNDNQRNSGRQNNGQNQREADSSKVCYHCGASGHVSPTCEVRLRGEQVKRFAESAQNKNKSYLAVTEEGESNGSAGH